MNVYLLSLIIPFLGLLYNLQTFRRYKKTGKMAYKFSPWSAETKTNFAYAKSGRGWYWLIITTAVYVAWFLIILFSVL